MALDLGSPSLRWDGRLHLRGEQLTRWGKGQLDSNQRQEVERLIKQVEELRKVCQQILSLAAELKKGTIDRILEKSDFELGLDILTRRIKPPKK